MVHRVPCRTSLIPDPEEVPKSPWLSMPENERWGWTYPLLVTELQKQTGLGGFEPPASGLEARRYVLAKPQTPVVFPYILVAWGY